MTFIKRFSKKMLLIPPILIILILSILFVLEVRAQEDLISTLETHLRESGIQVKSISIDSRIPLQITITLQSTTEGEHRTQQDVWDEFLTEREAALAHKFGLQLDSLTLVLINQHGELLDWSLRSLNPRDFPLAYKQFSAGNKTLNEQATAALLRQELNFDGLTVGELSVTRGIGSEQDVQSVSIQLIASSLNAANRTIPNITGFLSQKLDQINQESNYSMVAVIYLEIIDENGNNLLTYIYDVQLGKQTWGMAPGITTDWFPQPAPTWSPTAKVTSTPPGYPPPSSEPTALPTQYPYP
jgi:hypothetical protein